MEAMDPGTRNRISRHVFTPNLRDAVSFDGSRTTFPPNSHFNRNILLNLDPSNNITNDVYGHRVFNARDRNGRNDDVDVFQRICVLKKKHDTKSFRYKRGRVEHPTTTTMTPIYLYPMYATRWV